MAEGKRITELDIMKGMGIILIAVYHLVYRSMDGIADNMIRGMGWAYIGIFFLLSGYTFSRQDSVMQSYKKKVLGLLLPALMLELVLLTLGGIYCIFVHDYTFQDILHDAAVTVLRPEITTRISAEWGNGGVLFLNLSPVWFIWGMLWTELFFFPLRKLLDGKGEVIWCAAMLLLMGIQIPLYICMEPAPWGLTLVPTYLQFMLIGAKLREKNAVEMLKKIRPLPAFGLTVVCLAVHFGLFLFNGNENYYAGLIGRRGALDVFTVILQVLPAALAFFLIARAIGKVAWLHTGLEWLGRHTLGILMMHCLLGMVFCDMLGTYIKPGPNWYLELHNIPLTTEIILKSVLSCVLALAASVLLQLLWGKGKRARKGKK